MSSSLKNDNVVSTTEEELSLGGRIFNSRQNAGLSLHMTANLLGVKPNTLKSWENDRSEPRVNKLVALSGILGVSPTYFLAEEGNDGQGVIAVKGRNQKIINFMTDEISKAKEHQKELANCLKKMDMLIAKLQ